jgi:glutaredoxin
MNMFEIYSKVGCKYCDAIEKLFVMKDVSYQKKMLNIDFDKKDFVERFGESTFPRVILDGKVIGGAKETLQYLREEGIV